ncbi:DUF459 domain-containing protein [Agrobacterium larrymoorei]|uniref:SGNH/GDSL hydrolase family protein n=1 Tax=Agrobacterium larrymoorei TaxID=160699 RepID=UPI0015721B03|nr:DUF459 domain-containing protein [Agrobacterium larrymoorei]NTJ44018.1 DUF459 domain-containing protein [Agrobacterium larrymoorei]
MDNRSKGVASIYVKRYGAALLAVVLSLPSLSSDAFSQERVERRTLMEMLFGEPNRYNDRLYAPERREYREPRARRAPPRESNRAVSRPQAPRRTPSVVQMRTEKPAPVEKLENARRVLVIGDFLATGMGEALVSTFESSPAIAVDVRSNGSSGLVRDDYYDWFSNLPQFMKEISPATIVIMMGSNDRQMMEFGGNKEKYGTEAWFKEYERRIDALIAIARRQQVPVLWVGLPAFQSPSLTADFVGFNRLYRSHIEKAGGEFVDVWDGFVDEGGKFVTTGYDVSGQQVRLREADGIGMTQAGKQKLAFYVEKFVRRHLDGAGPDLMKLDGSNLPSLTSLPALGIDAQQVRTQPISLTDPDLDGGDTLLGDKPVAKFSVVETPREKLTRRGLMDDAPIGRVDDYRMPAPDETAAK